MVQHFNDSNFDQEVLHSDVPVMVDFYADWCGPCRMVSPIVEELAGQYTGKVKVGKLNVDESSAVAREIQCHEHPDPAFCQKRPGRRSDRRCPPQGQNQQHLELL